MNSLIVGFTAIVAFAPVVALVIVLLWDIVIERGGKLFADPDDFPDDKQYFI